MKALKEFLSLALNKEINQIELINTKKSDSTNSYYFIAKLNNDIYAFNFSDHNADNHNQDCYDITLDMDNNFDDLIEEIMDNTNLNDFYENINDESYFGIEIATTYNLNINNLIGKNFLPRLFLNKSTQIKDAKLIEDNKVLLVKYADEECVYVNFDLNEFANDEDIALINFLINEYDVHTARKYFFNQTVSIKKGNKLNNDFDNLVKYNNKNYIINTELV